LTSEITLTFLHCRRVIVIITLFSCLPVIRFINNRWHANTRPHAHSYSSN